MDVGVSHPSDAARSIDSFPAISAISRAEEPAFFHAADFEPVRDPLVPTETLREGAEYL